MQSYKETISELYLFCAFFPKISLPKKIPVLLGCLPTSPKPHHGLLSQEMTFPTPRVPDKRTIRILTWY